MMMSNAAEHVRRQTGELAQIAKQQLEQLRLLISQLLDSVESSSERDYFLDQSNVIKNAEHVLDQIAQITRTASFEGFSVVPVEVELPRAKLPKLLAIGAVNRFVLSQESFDSIWGSAERQSRRTMFQGLVLYTARRVRFASFELVRTPVRNVTVAELPADTHLFCNVLELERGNPQQERALDRFEQENERLTRENDRLQRENDVLKQQNDSLKRGTGRLQQESGRHGRAGKMSEYEGFLTSEHFFFPFEGMHPGSFQRVSEFKANPEAKTQLSESVIQNLQALVKQKALLEPAEFARQLHWSRQALSKALNASRVFYVEAQGNRYFPAFFADSALERKQLESVSKLLKDLPGGAKLQFFLTPKGSLGGVTPLKALEKGQYAAVQAAAAGFADR